TLRISFPGTGDSVGSPRDPARVPSWTRAVASAARWLCARTGRSITAIGIGLGGLMCLEALAGDAPIDGLVLWAVPSSGAAILRELRALASLKDSWLLAAG